MAPPAPSNLHHCTGERVPTSTVTKMYVILLVSKEINNIILSKLAGFCLRYSHFTPLVSLTKMYQTLKGKEFGKQSYLYLRCTRTILVKMYKSSTMHYFILEPLYWAKMFKSYEMCKSFIIHKYLENIWSMMGFQ